ncbi:hypothetical protein Glove_302g76 [Diversispora epigaea]|uniref:Treble clef zinc finger domain-containing protein n=1 Tax=Diversispora epigaea TaxID=1348612 RepID=A0A397HVG8_9GLOM|nr:hypothetical protein Glove_302g76 [Diversispora epigaea]
MPFQIKYSIYDARKIAESRGGQCLSDNYINCNTSLRWKCAKGHEWTANFHSIKNGKTWCSICSDTRLNISVAKELARNKNGECLSEKYINNRSPLLWRCDKGHEWTTNFISIKYKNTWCPDCAHRRPLTLKIAKQIANNKNGECLSTEYKNCDTNLLWRCIKGHEWYARLSSIKRGQWCPHCMGVTPHTFEDAKQIAYNRNGKCLSTEYKNCDTKLLWCCVKGHKWYASFNKVNKHNTWCPHCVGNVRYTLEVAKQIAVSRNGECLSTEYINTRSDLLWKCTNGHLWNAPLWNIKIRGTWCPYCSKYKRENLCREIIIKYLGPPSENRKPDFLKTPEYPTGLQLDIPYYNYGFAIEVQGQQHEKYVEFFHRGNPNNFINQQERDQLKKELCEENWIVLRYVWYYEDPYIVIPDHLRELGLI